MAFYLRLALAWAALATGVRVDDDLHLTGGSQSAPASTQKTQVVGEENLPSLPWSDLGSIFFACLFTYGGCCMLNELYIAKTEKEEGQKERILEWDGIRFLVQILIVRYHLQLTVMCPKLIVHMTTAKDPLTYFPKFGPTAVEQCDASADLTDWLVYGYPGTFRMPVFVFMSGVFGQKIDRMSMLRVCCYTWGTSAIFALCFHIVHRVSDGAVPLPSNHSFLWYLSSLFFWRFTLSPLFDYTKNLPVFSRVALLALVSVIGVAGYDLVGSSIERFQKNTVLPLMPSETFILAPYFAVGLLLPYRKWTELLRNGYLQAAGVFVIVAAVGVTFTAQYRAWLFEGTPDHYMDRLKQQWPAILLVPTQFSHVDQLEHHWPYLPSDEAFSMQRLAVSVAWLIYKGVLSFGAIWSMSALTSLCTKLVPVTSTFVLGNGCRSLYSYVMHIPVILLSLGCNLHLTVQAMPTPMWRLSSIALSVALVLMLTCRLTESILHRIVLPFWLLDLLPSSITKPSTAKNLSQETKKSAAAEEAAAVPLKPDDRLASKLAPAG